MQLALIIAAALAAMAMVTGCGAEEAPGGDPPATQPADSLRDEAPPAPPPPATAAGVKPLGVGDWAPTATLRRPDGQAVDLADLYAAKPTVLIFYRGGWCPYCSTHLGQIATVEPQLVAMGYQVLAISPDRPEELQSTLDKQGLAYQLLSDSPMELARAFRLAFTVDAATRETYRGYGIDLEGASGFSHHLLPVPAVYIVDTDGVIRFAHWDADYKQRLSPGALLGAARQAAAPEE